jgi:hypothetical protein
MRQLRKCDLSPISSGRDDRLQGRIGGNEYGSASEHPRHADHGVAPSFAASGHARARTIAENGHADAEADSAYQHSSY